MADQRKHQARFTASPIKKKIKMGGNVVVSEALIKDGASNLMPKVHVKRGDLVMVISGQSEKGRGKTGKVLQVFPSEGKLVVEGVNMITRATKKRSVTGQDGLIKREGKIWASKVMLYCAGCKKPTRLKHKALETGKKTRICRHCNEALDA